MAENDYEKNINFVLEELIYSTIKNKPGNIVSYFY